MGRCPHDPVRGPHSWLFWLGSLKAGGAAGLVFGIAVPAIGLAASGGLVVFFIGAMFTLVRARWYLHLRYAAPFVLLAVLSLCCN